MSGLEKKHPARLRMVPVLTIAIMATTGLNGCAVGSSQRMDEVTARLDPQYYDWFDGGAPVEMNAFDWNHVEFARQALAAGNTEEAVGILHAMMERGFPPGYYELGQMYEKGLGVPRDPAKAAQLYGEAIRRPSSILDNASLRLARLYRDGIGVEQDDTLAYLLTRQAVDAGGGASAKLELADMLVAGRGTTANLQEARLLYQSVAEAGRPRGFHALAQAYSPGGWLPEDQDRASMYIERYVAMLEPRAQSGDSGAMAQLARLYADDGLLPRPEKHRDWWLQAAEAGDTDAQGEAGEILLSEGHAARGLTMLRNAAEAGDVEAMMHLGRAYQGKNGVAADPDQAVRWLTEAASRGSASSAAALGRMYLHGRGVGRDPAKGVRYLEQAVAQGHASARVDLGEALLHGDGVRADPERGIALLRQMAPGNASVQLILGRAYLEGTGVRQSSAQARRYLTGSAKGGNAYAAQLLGEAYLTGQGMPQDAQQADQWLSRASQAGRLSARTLLGRALLRGEDGLAQDIERGRQLLLSAAVRGHAGAQATLGRELLTGEHLQVDRNQGVEYLVKAAQQGHPTARLALAKAYLWANGLENANQQQALLWLDKVIDGDSQMALETMRQLLTGNDSMAITIL